MQLNCKKEDVYNAKPNVEDKFFAIPSGTNASVMRVINKIKRRNNVKEFVTKFAAQNGFPVWNKVLMATSQKQYANASLYGNSLDGVTDTTILIPFVMEGEFSVKGFIKATLNDSVSLSYSLAKDYKTYEEKLDNSKTASSAFAMLSMVLNKTVFNEEYYKITNPKLFSDDTAHVSTQSIKIENISFTITDSAGFKQTIICADHSIIQTHCGTPDAAQCNPHCDAPFCPTGQCWQVESTQTACYTVGLNSTNMGTGGGDNGGGGEIPYVYPCQGTQNNPTPFTATNNIEDPGDCPVPGPGDGWIPLEDDDYIYFLETLSPAQSEFWNNVANSQYVQIFSNYLYENSFSTAAKDFIYWATNFLINNPGTTIEQFQNWFMGESEGNDGGALFNFDDYSSISVLTYANLPGRNEFYTAFPKVGTGGMPSSQVYQLVGGHPWQAHQAGNSNYQNACAIRVSCALNYSNHPLPVYSNNAGQQKTEKGDDNKNYMLDATSLLSYMLKAYPNNPPLHLVNQTPDQFLNAIKGKWGIYIMIPKSRTDFGASGHADFFSSSGCLSGCYFEYAKEIYFWELF